MSSLSAHSIKTSDEGSAKELSQDTPESSDSGLLLRLENQLLRSEVSLPQPGDGFSHPEGQRPAGRVEPRSSPCRPEELGAVSERQMLRDLRSKVDDLTESLSAKDAQLAVLKVRLDEADQMLKSRSAALEEALKERSGSRWTTRRAAACILRLWRRSRRGCATRSCPARREQDSYRQMQGEFAGRLSKVEATSLQPRARRRRLQDYKHKAARILQSKEKLISSLKEGSGLDSLDGGGGAAALELEDLKHEREMQKEDIQKLQGQLHTLRIEIQELQYLEEEQHRAKATLQSRIKDREDDIQRLRNQLTNKALSSSSQTELESRLHQLTETLIQKQTMLEALGTEKSALVFQMERLETQLKSREGGHSGGPSINMSNLEGPAARQRNAPVLFSDQESPGVYGKVRKAASSIDRFSIRLGIFLRRYPMARVFVILYIALLHLWVMVVLLTYTPEMHHGHPDGR
ncbi:hypothetical protein KUCAC02_036626 [Chaenocephalus aceratus]|nr:hypothetical protein KUCAC02_036626 [Chaenocephalus aceratus]